jgi:hypothetical protein
MSGGSDFTTHCSDLGFNSLVHSISSEASSETVMYHGYILPYSFNILFIKILCLLLKVCYFCS